MQMTAWSKPSLFLPSANVHIISLMRNKLLCCLTQIAVNLLKFSSYLIELSEQLTFFISLSFLRHFFFLTSGSDHFQGSILLLLLVFLFLPLKCFDVPKFHVLFFFSCLVILSRTCVSKNPLYTDDTQTFIFRNLCFLSLSSDYPIF